MIPEIVDMLYYFWCAIIRYMPYTRTEKIKSIASNLAFSSETTILENTIGLFDSNRVAQDFFIGLLNRVFDYDLVNLDKLNEVGLTYPAIDLADKNARVAIQVTTDASRAKIKDTIEKFIRHRLDKDYDRLIVLIIGKKKRYQKDFDTGGKLDFDRENDIWDDGDLMKAIDTLEIDKLEDIESYLQKSLIEFKYPDNIFPQDIENSLIFLEKELKTMFEGIKLSDNSISSTPDKRDDEYIIRKNTVNDVNWDFFVDKIRGHLDYNALVNEYLYNPINKKMQQKYFEITAFIQEFYNSNRDSFSSFEDVFRTIFEELNFYNAKVSANKVGIILHNMYFNCDIGDKPE